MRKLAVAFCLLAVCACASPYAGQARQLRSMYERGEITANEYAARMNELQALDLQWRQGLAQSWQRMWQPPRQTHIWVHQVP